MLSDTIDHRPKGLVVLKVPLLDSLFDDLTFCVGEAYEGEQVLVSKLVGEGVDPGGDRLTFIVDRNATGIGEPVSRTASVFVRSLLVAGYETGRPDSADVSVYEPRSGWYEGRETYRLTEATGELRVNPDTNRLKSANVSWKVTTPVGTYAEYMLARLTSDDPTTHRITFEFDSDTYALRRPPWINRSDFE